MAAFTRAPSTDVDSTEKDTLSANPTLEINKTLSVEDSGPPPLRRTDTLPAEEEIAPLTRSHPIGSYRAVLSVLESAPTRSRESFIYALEQAMHGLNQTNASAVLSARTDWAQQNADVAAAMAIVVVTGQVPTLTDASSAIAPDLAELRRRSTDAGGRINPPQFLNELQAWARQRYALSPATPSGSAARPPSPALTLDRASTTDSIAVVR